MNNAKSGKGTVGVFVDVGQISRNGGYGTKFDVLRAFACRDGAEPMRLNAYVTFDQERALSDGGYRAAQENYYSLLRDFGYKVIQKTTKWYLDESGNRFGKANADLDMAVDILLQSEGMDRVLLVTGDGDFEKVVQALQNKGCRVELLAFENVSQTLRREVDIFVSGYFVPGLLPPQIERDAGVGGPPSPWGEVGSRVRGVCYSHHEKGYGFMRFLRRMSEDLWKIDSRLDDSPYATAFFHDTSLPQGVLPAELPSRSLIFEFELTVDEAKNRGFVAKNIHVVSPKRRATTGSPARGAEANTNPATATQAGDEVQPAGD